METSFINGLMNSLPARIAVLDARGVIVEVNEAWKRYAQHSGEGNDAGVGTNYLAVCEQAVLCAGDKTAEALLHGILDLLRGNGSHFCIEYTRHSPTRERWFMANVSSFTHGGATYIVIAHEDISSLRGNDHPSGLRHAGHRLDETESTLYKVMNVLPIGVWITDRHGNIVHGNPAGKKIWAGARYIGPDQFGEYKGWWLNSGRPIAADEWAVARAVQKGETSIDEEIRIECFDGSSKIILNSAVPLRNACNDIIGAIVINQDITARKQAEDQLRQASTAIDAKNRELQQVLAREQATARTDDLTGLKNRRYFFELCRQAFDMAQRYRIPFALLLFDIDNFKWVNDTLGHQAGDRLLQRVARIACDHVRDADILARYGGEEFIVALPNTDAQGALAVAENLRKSIAAHRQITDDGDLSITISAGIAEKSSREDTLENLIQFADEALYAAKNAGRNRSKVAYRSQGSRPSRDSLQPS